MNLVVSGVGIVEVESAARTEDEIFLFSRSQFKEIRQKTVWPITSAYLTLVESEWMLIAEKKSPVYLDDYDCFEVVNQEFCYRLNAAL